MKEYIISIENVDTGEYFFTTDHCQPHNLGSQWVSCTYGPLPGNVTPRIGVEDGLVKNKEDWKIVFGNYGNQILNPQPVYQA